MNSPPQPHTKSPKNSPFKFAASSFSSSTNTAGKSPLLKNSSSRRNSLHHGNHSGHSFVSPQQEPSISSPISSRQKNARHPSPSPSQYTPKLTPQNVSYYSPEEKLEPLDDATLGNRSNKRRSTNTTTRRRKNQLTPQQQYRKNTTANRYKNTPSTATKSTFQSPSIVSQEQEDDDEQFSMDEEELIQSLARLSSGASKKSSAAASRRTTPSQHRKQQKKQLPNQVVNSFYRLNATGDNLTKVSSSEFDEVLSQYSFLGEDESLSSPRNHGTAKRKPTNSTQEESFYSNYAADEFSSTQQNKPSKSSDAAEVFYPSLNQPILLDETTYMTKLSYSTQQWHLSIVSPHFHHIEYQIHVTAAHHSRITKNHPIQPKALFELVKGALLEGAASFDYFWMSGTEYMTLGRVDEMVVSQNGWKGDAKAETDRLLLWVGLARDLGYWLILEPVRVEVSAKQVLRKLKHLEEEYARVLSHNKSILIKNEVLERQQETAKAEQDKLNGEIHDLKKENGKLKQMLVNMIQHMVQKQQRMMRALGNLEALHGNDNDSPRETEETQSPLPAAPQKGAATFSWNPLKKHSSLYLSNYCRTITCKSSPGRWVSCLGDEIWTEGEHRWSVILKGAEDPHFKSVIIGVAHPSHSLSQFCGSTETSYGFFIHSGKLYHNEVPKQYVKTVRSLSEREDEHSDSCEDDGRELPFIQFKPNDCISVILNLNDGTLKYVYEDQVLRVAYVDVKGPLCACISFCDSTCVELK